MFLGTEQFGGHFGDLIQGMLIAVLFEVTKAVNMCVLTSFISLTYCHF